MDYRWKRLTFLIIILITFSQLSSVFVKSNGSLNLEIRRTFGIGLGSNVQGTFTIYGSGSTEIEWDNLSITFNEDEVAFAEGSEITFQCKTKNYNPGEINITLWGYDSEGTLSFTSRTVNFLKPWATTLIITLTIILVIGAGTYKYGPKIQSYIQKKKNERNEKVNENGRC